jgi:short-subunit dehydrogenase
VGRQRDKLEQAAEQIGSCDGRLWTFAGDVTQPSDLQQLKDFVAQQLGGVDFLCHCAGRSMRGDVLGTSPEMFRELWEINFLATVRVTQSLGLFVEESHGHVVLVGSLASRLSPRYLGAYPASKFPLAAYAQQLRLAWGQNGPHVLLVCPGPIARGDAGQRYHDAVLDLPPSAALPAGGAKVRAVDPQWLAERILRDCERRKAELIVPGMARLLFLISDLSPRLGDWLLSRMTGH